MKIKRNSKVKFRARTASYAVLAPITLLLVCGVGLISPIMPSRAKADCLTEAGENCTRSTADLDAEVTVGTSIAIGIKDKIALDLTPTSSGTVTTGSTKVQVATNSVEGYTLYIKGDSELKDTSNVNTTADTDSIKALANEAKLTDFPLNTYAYYLGTADSNTIYQPVDTNGNTPAKVTNSTTNTGLDSDHAYGDEYDLTLGVRVGTNLPAGIYAGKVTLSAVANPETVKSLAGLTYMQDMTSEICNATRENYTKRLIDTRDGKSYWVAKLADGNCWMTQNLALDIYNDNGIARAIPDGTDTTTITDASNFTILNKDNTNIPEIWSADSERCKNLPDGYACAPNTVSTVAPINHGAPPSVSTNSWDFSKFIFVNPTAAVNCAATTLNLDNLRVALSKGQGDLNVCANIGALDVNSEDWQPTFTAQNGWWKYDESTNTVITSLTPLENGTQALIAADTTAKTYDAHYLIGNYYQFNAALAGYGGIMPDSNGSIEGLNGTKWSGVENTNVEYNICPKGWTMPISGENEGSFYNLLDHYGLWSTNSNSEYNINTKPLYLMRSGEVNKYYGALSQFGNSVALWSRSATKFDAFPTRYANWFYINGTRTASMQNSYRWNGLGVRCLNN